MRGRHLIATILRRRGGGIALVVRTPTTGCPSRGARLQRVGAGEPGSWALEPRARLLLGRLSVGGSDSSPWSRRGYFYAGCFENFRGRALRGDRASGGPELGLSDVQGSLRRRLRWLPLNSQTGAPKSSDLVSACLPLVLVNRARSDCSCRCRRRHVTYQQTLCALTAA